MARIVAIGLTALILTACGPAAQTTPTEPVAPAGLTSAQPAEPLAPAAATSAQPTKPVAKAAASDAPQPAAPMSWEAMQDRYRQMEVLPKDPLEAMEMRAVLCSHYSSEFGGDNSERDQWLNAQMDKYRCGDELVAEARAMRAARSGERAVVARLDTVLAQFE